MTRKFLEAAIEIDLDEDDEEEDSDEEEELDDDKDNLRSWFQKAFNFVKSTDTQGYRISSSPSSGTKMRSIQDLTALSWVYFSTRVDPQDSVSYRLPFILVH